MQRFSLGLVCLLSAAVSFGQSLTDDNSHGWYMYFGDHAVSKHWGVHVEGQWRRAEVITQWQQLLLRPGVNYQLNRNMMLTLGYGYVQSYPYGDYPTAQSAPEHRVYQQLLAKHKTKAIGWQHRFRLEQRLVGQRPVPAEGVKDWQYRNRFRYMLRTDVPLTRGGLSQRGLYLGFYDEVFYGFGAHRGPQWLDQNRAYGAVGYNFGAPGKLEFGYLHQYVPQRNGIVVEHNHTLQVAFYSSFSFRKQR